MLLKIKKIKKCTWRGGGGALEGGWCLGLMQKHAYLYQLNSNCFDRGSCESGLEINFFNREPAGVIQKNFGCQIINFGRQLTLYIHYTRRRFYTLLCMQEKS